MDINKEKKDELNAVLKVHVKPEDYQEKVNEVIKDYKKKAKMDGFRPGKVPEGLIRKMYGRAIKIDEINRVVSEKLTEYIRSEDLNILGEPLPSKEEKDKEINWDQDKEFEFSFDIGLAPELEVKITKHDKVPYYNVTPTDELVDQQVDGYQRRMGDFKEVDKVSDLEEMLKVDLEELDEDGNTREDGVKKVDVSISLTVIKDEEIKKQFQDAKQGDVIKTDLKKAYPSEAELSSMLVVDKENLENVNNFFNVKINEVKKFEQAELNQDLFDKVYGEGEVTSEEEFKQKVREEIEEQLKPESENKFAQDVKEHFVRKVDPKLPSEFLKRWLKESQKNEELTEEQIDKDFPLFEKDVKWDLIKNKIIKENEIKVEENEVLQLAKELTMMQFRQYGMMNFPDEQLEQYAKQLLQKEEERRKLYERKYEEKVVEHIKENIKLQEKDVNFDEFKEIVEKDNEAIKQ